MALLGSSQNRLTMRFEAQTSAGAANQSSVASVNQPLTVETSPYARLADRTRERMESLQEFGLDVAAVAIPSVYRAFLSKNQRFRITTSAWTVGRRGSAICDLRMVLITGSVNTIINTWAFPYQPQHHPVYAAELIAFGGAPRLSFMDIQVPALSDTGIEAVRAVTAAIRIGYPELRSDELPPSWAIEATAGHYLFTRQLPPESFAPISDAYMALLDAYFDLIRSSVPRNGDEALKLRAIKSLREYQIHHLESSPGKVFLGKVFGDDWTESFLTEFLFRKPGVAA